jgi:polyhydroxyalkanoate synthesis repressor PhaR
MRLDSILVGMTAEPRMIKQYAGRRLYDPKALRYVSLDDLAEMVLKGERFVVKDADTGEDITRSLLDRIHE